MLHAQLLRQLEITLNQVATVTDLPAILIDLQQPTLRIPDNIRLPARHPVPLPRASPLYSPICQWKKKGARRKRKRKGTRAPDR